MNSLSFVNENIPENNCIVVIMLYSQYRELTCHGKKTGDWSSGTRSGTTKMSSKSSPSNNGTTPSNSTATTTDFKPC